MNKIRLWLSHPRLPVIVALLAVLLTLPSVWNGLNLDDYYHRGFGKAAGDIKPSTRKECHHGQGHAYTDHPQDDHRPAQTH